MRNAAVRSLGQWFLLLAGIMIGLATVQTAAAIPPVDIGTRREMFVDRSLIASMKNTRLALAHPERREVVMEANAPWEDRYFFAYSAVQEGGKVRLYYRAAISDTKHGGAMVDPYQGIIGAMAESNDGGRTFFRPKFGSL